MKIERIAIHAGRKLPVQKQFSCVHQQPLFADGGMHRLPRCMDSANNSHPSQLDSTARVLDLFFHFRNLLESCARGQRAVERADAAESRSPFVWKIAVSSLLVNLSV